MPHRQPIFLWYSQNKAFEGRTGTKAIQNDRFPIEQESLLETAAT